MKEWTVNFWTENGTRLTYAILVFVVTIPMYLLIEPLREQLQGIWLVIVGILVGKVRTSFGEIQGQIAENQREQL